MGRLLSQLKALLWKNILLKKRNKKQLFPELLLPIYFVALLALIKALISPETLEEIPEHPEYGLLNQSVFPQKFSEIYVSPDLRSVKNIMDIVVQYLNISYSIFSNQKAAEDAYLSNSSFNVLGVVFGYDGDVISNFAIRVPFDDSPGSTDFFNYVDGGCHQENGLGSCMANRYLTSGFTALQLAINTAMLQINTNHPGFPFPDVSMKLLPKPAYTPNTSYIQILSAIYFVMAFSPFINFLVVNLVTEKEKRIKEGMRMMGMKDSAFWLSWSIIYAVIIFAVTLVVVAIAAISNFFANSNMFIFFLMLFLYGLSVITFSFMVTPFFNKALTAGAIASFASMVISLLYLIVSLTRTVTRNGDVDYTIPPEWRWVLCLLSPVALALAIDQAIFLDIGHGGMTFDTITYGNFPLYSPIIMLAVDVVLYGVLAIYLDNVIPSEYGPRRSFYYIVTPSYWCGSNDEDGETVRLISYDGLRNSAAQNDPDVEPVTSDLLGKEGIRLSHLKKVFKGTDGEVAAIDDLTLDIYEGQITGLLGHNGAGKTTLINMLTGLTSPTAGKATVLGQNISNPNGMDKIRTRCGVCPQHNILFDRLTPREHLILFAGIKAIPSDQIEEAIEESLENVDLTDRADTLAEELSGGQKRKLSVAIALLGNPKVIFLDEPTAGMDPYSRRHLWAFLQKMKQGKIILLTTHFMDEADILADRKAIISKGSLRCCGSSLFLKNKFGIGYYLNMLMSQDCDAKTVTSFIAKHVEGVSLSRCHGTELSYTLPMSQLQTFPGLFNALEETDPNGLSMARAIGIQTFGVSMTTLEEVFLTLGNNGEVSPKENGTNDKPITNGRHTYTKNKDNELTNSAQAKLDTSSEHNSSVELSPIQELGTPSKENITIQRLTALFKIRTLMMIRDRNSIAFQLLIPVVFVIIGCIVNKSAVPPNSMAEPPSLKMETALAQYVDIKAVQVPTAAPIVIIDSSGSGTVTIFKHAVEGIATMEDADDSWDFLNATPHHVGINFSTLDAIDQGYKSKFTILYNDTAIHSLPVTIDLVMNILYGLMIAQAPEQRLTTYNLPWNSTRAKLEFNNQVFSSGILISLAFVLIPSGFAVLIVREREWKARCQLRVSGVTWSIYWGSLFMFNILQYCVPAVLCIIVIFAVGVEALMSSGAILCLIILLLLYMPMNTLVAYNFSFLFKKHDTCMSVLPNIFLFSSLLPFVAVVISDLMGRPETAMILHHIFGVLDPPYLIYGGVYYIDRMHRIKILTNQNFTLSDYFKFENGIVNMFVVSVFHMVWLYFLLLFLEIRSTGGDPWDVLNVFRGKGHNPSFTQTNSDVIENEDTDVAAERQVVETLESQQPKEGPVIFVKGLRKEFKNCEKLKSEKPALCRKTNKTKKTKVAVRNSSFIVSPGEVFGLLGPNGAGKTTTINMIIAEEGMTKGKIEVAGNDIRSSLSEAFQALGFCPQHDALWERITLREHLNSYAAIRGVPSKDIKPMVDYFIESLHLQPYANKHAKKLSGGTKRKLSYAMSMLGNPRVVLLDEPSTGMDPQSKRFLWDAIISCFRFKDRGAILTTHYMEEADVLCSRVAIMVNGQIHCLGPTQHLKDKFGSGYVLEVKIHPGCETKESRAKADINVTTDKMSQLEHFVKTLFPGSVCAEQFGDRAQFQIPRTDIYSLGKTFSLLEEAKSRCELSEYSFSQSTLEQVFLTFAKQQKPEGEEEIRESVQGENVAEAVV